MCLDNIEKVKVIKNYGWKVFRQNVKTEKLFSLFAQTTTIRKQNIWLKSTHPQPWIMFTLLLLVNG